MMAARLSCNINETTQEEIRELMHRKGITATEVIRRSVAVLDYLLGEQSKGSKIQILDRETGEITEIIILS